MSKITDLTALLGANVDQVNDLLEIVDVSETGAARNKKITAAELLGLAAGGTIDNSDWSGADLEIANGGTGASSAGAARTNLDVYSKAEVDAAVSGVAPGFTAEWTPNFTAAGDVYIPADEAMTISQGNAQIGTGTLAYTKSTTAAPSTFSATTLPATVEAGAWLKVTASAVTGFVATHLKRTA